MIDFPGDLVQAFVQHRAIFFLSAGCSIPSGIPSADQLSEEVALAAYGAAGHKVSFDEFKQKTFGSRNPTLNEVAEYFFQRDGTLDVFAGLIFFPRWSRRPNGAHDGVVRLAKEGFFDSVLTTNWDELLETACHNASCTLARIRRPADFTVSAAVDLRIYKIHGCLTDPSSLIAATSQIEAVDDSQYLWAEPQLLAIFQGCSVVFVGYSGSIDKISRTMARVAEWSDPRARHYVVDRCDWAAFSGRVPEFVTSARLAEDQFFGLGAEEFVNALVHRLIRYLVLEVVYKEAASELSDILELVAGHPPEAFAIQDNDIEAIVGAEVEGVFLTTLLRTADGCPAVRSNERVLARAVAWVSYLTARGWRLVEGYPVMTTGDRWVYFAAGDLAASAKKVARHVLMLLQRPRFYQSILGAGERSQITCLLLLVQGTPGDVELDDLVTDAPANDLTHGYSPKVIFRTESEFLQEVQNPHD